MILTDEDIKAIYDNEKGGDYYDTVWAIEAAILEKLSRSEPVYQFRPDCENWIDCTEKFYAEWMGEKRMLFMHLPAPRAPSAVEAKYNELLLAVQRKFPDETRHETALRYIKTAEAPSYTNAARSEK